MAGIFVTGTDTGIGKTYVASCIIKALRKQGIDVGVMKPAETGCRISAGRLVPKDAAILKHSAGVRDSLTLVNPYRFRLPLAPLAAARQDGKRIEIPRILSAFRTLKARHDLMIVEGAGGIMVPLTDCYSYLDLAEALHLPILIVARPGLGTINHTLLTIQALRERGTDIIGIVINYAKKQRKGLAERTSPDIITAMSGIKVLGTVSYGSGLSDNALHAICGQDQGRCIPQKA